MIERGVNSSTIRSLSSTQALCRVMARRCAWGRQLRKFTAQGLGRESSAPPDSRAIRACAMSEETAPNTIPPIPTERSSALARGPLFRPGRRQRQCPCRSRRSAIRLRRMKHIHKKPREPNAFAASFDTDAIHPSFQSPVFQIGQLVSTRRQARSNARRPVFPESAVWAEWTGQTRVPPRNRSAAHPQERDFYVENPGIARELRHSGLRQRATTPCRPNSGSEHPPRVLVPPVLERRLRGTGGPLKREYAPGQFRRHV